MSRLAQNLSNRSQENPQFRNEVGIDDFGGETDETDETTTLEPLKMNRQLHTFQPVQPASPSGQYQQQQQQSVLGYYHEASRTSLEKLFLKGAELPTANGTSLSSTGQPHRDSSGGRFTRWWRETVTPEAVQITTLCMLWYGSSALTNNIAKQLFQVVKCPVTLTYVQFGFVAFFCFMFGYMSSAPAASTLTRHMLPQPRSTMHRYKEQAHQLLKWVGHLPRMTLPIPALRRVLQALFWVISAMLGFIFTLLSSTLSLIKYWVRLGLGIHEDNFSKSNQIPMKLRLNGSHIHRPTWDIIKMMAPLTGFLISGHVFSSIAISNVPVSFVHTIKALSPLFTVLAFRVLWSTRYTSQVYISLMPLTAGVMLACASDISFNLVGLVCSVASTLIFVGQNIFSKKLFKERKLDKLNMLLYSSTISFTLMTPIWFWSEGHQILFASHDHEHHQPIEHDDEHLPLTVAAMLSPQVFSLFVLNGLSHFGQNVFAFSILALVSPVTYSIASLVKRIVVIVASIIWFGQHVRTTQALGIVLTFVGLWMYQYAKMNDSTGLNASHSNGSTADLRHHHRNKSDVEKTSPVEEEVVISLTPKSFDASTDHRRVSVAK